MSDLRIVDLNAKTTPAGNDLLELLDVSDTTDPLASDAQGSNKKVTVAHLATAVGASLGLGTAATHAATDFDAAGAASSAQSAAESYTDSSVAALSSVYQPLDGDLTALAALSGTATIYYRSGASTWSAVTVGSGLSFSGGTLSATGGGGMTIGAAVSGGTANCVLFVDGGGNLADSTNLEYTTAGGLLAVAGSSAPVTVRKPSGTPGTDEGQIYADTAKLLVGQTGYLFRFTEVDNGFGTPTPFLAADSGTITIFGFNVWVGPPQFNNTIVVDGLGGMIRLPSGAPLGWGSGTAYGTASDTQLYRYSAGVVRQDDGGVGNNVGLVFTRKSSTTAGREAAYESAGFNVTTDASRTGFFEAGVYYTTTAYPGLHIDAAATGANLALLTSTGSYGGGVGVVFLPNAVTNPSSNPTGGVVQYASGGAPQWKDALGKIRSAPTWFDVTAFGAVGDGSTDDKSAINAAIAALNAAGAGVLYFPATANGYLVSGVLTTITANCTVKGDGPSAFASPQSGTNAFVSKVCCSSQTSNLFVVTGIAVNFENLTLVNTYAGTASAGAGILSNASSAVQKVNYRDVYVKNFYNGIDIQSGCIWDMDGCVIDSCVNYGLSIQNTTNADAGDWSIVSSQFLCGASGAAGIFIATSGGGKIVNCKINGGFTHGIWVAVTAGKATSDLQICNCSIENTSDAALYFVNGSGGTWANILLSGLQVAMFATNKAAIVMAATASGDFTNVSVLGGVFTNGGTTHTVIEWTNITHSRIIGITNAGFGGLYTLTTCSGIETIGTGETAWTEVGSGGAPAFQNSWANTGGGEETAAFRQLSSGQVQIKGNIGGGTLTGAAFTLPAGYRPGGYVRFPIASNNAYGQVTVQPGGAVVPTIGATTNVQLDICFLAEQ